MRVELTILVAAALLTQVAPCLMRVGRLEWKKPLTLLISGW